MSADINAAKKRLTDLRADMKRRAEIGSGAPWVREQCAANATAIDIILAEFSRLEVENEGLRISEPEALHAVYEAGREEISRLQAALAEAKEARSVLQQAVLDRTAERDNARRQIAERDETLKLAIDVLTEFSCEYDGFEGGNGQPDPVLMRARSVLAALLASSERKGVDSTDTPATAVLADADMAHVLELLHEAKRRCITIEAARRDIGPIATQANSATHALTKAISLLTPAHEEGEG